MRSGTFLGSPLRAGNPRFHPSPLERWTTLPTEFLYAPLTMVDRGAKRPAFVVPWGTLILAVALVVFLWNGRTVEGTGSVDPVNRLALELELQDPSPELQPSADSKAGSPAPQPVQGSQGRGLAGSSDPAEPAPSAQRAGARNSGATE